MSRSIRLLIALALGSLAFSASAGVLAGRISFLIGDVTLQQGVDLPRPLVRTDVVEVGQTVYTGASGHLHIKMVDNAFISVRPNSRLQISQYEYDAANPANSKIKFVLEEGVARSITGKGGEAARSGYRLNTPLAAIGIRGTDFVVQADALATRVSVQSGAVVMTPLGADCRAEALGPCNLSSTRVLTAAMRDAYLELRSRSGTPQLVPAEKALDAPNKIAPPRQEEPGVSSNSSQSGLSAKTTASSDPLSTVQRDIAATAITANIDRSPLAVPVPPEPARFWWGRWQSWLQPGEQGIAAVALTGREVSMSNEMFGLFKEAGYPALELNSGVVKFQLAASEAYIVNGAAVAAAAVSNPSLSIDFGGRRFNTAATFTSTGLAPISVAAQGPVSAQGLLIADGNSATSNVVGNVTSRGEQAAMLFKQVGPANTTAFGATRWVR